MGFDGYVKIRDSDGSQVLDIVVAHLTDVAVPGHRWTGTIEVSAGGGLDGKRLPVLIEAPGRFSAGAILGPTLSQDGDQLSLSVLGTGPVPF
jgi:hypothetical protein